MSIERLIVDDFRNLQGIDVELGPRFNLFLGRNGAGKTAMLEAAFYLGRGRSFRSGVVSELIRHGTPGFVLQGSVLSESGAPRSVGVSRLRSGESRFQVDGAPINRIGVLTALVPTQVVTGSVAELIEGPPRLRRGWIDWLLFHVEPGFSEQFRRLQIALRQRAAVLKEIREHRASVALLDPWDRELTDVGNVISAFRARRLGELAPLVLDSVRELGLDIEVHLELWRGWRRDAELGDELAQRRQRDAQLGHTTAGPHKADVAIRTSDGLGRREFSRGQGKLLSMAMILAGFDVLRSERSIVGTLLLDEIASDLDEDGLRGLLRAVERRPIQVLASAVRVPEHGIFSHPEKHITFHVERGQVRTA